MKICSRQTQSIRAGFTLVMTLSVLAAVTILVVGLFSIVSRERQTSSAFDAVEQAELALQAGFEQAGGLLKQALQDETALVVAVPTAPWIGANDSLSGQGRVVQDEFGKAEASSLFAVGARVDPGAPNGLVWTYTPLVSGVAGSEPTAVVPAHPELAALRTMNRPMMPGAFVNGQPSFNHLPAQGEYSEEELREMKWVAQQAGLADTPWQRTPQKFWVELALPALGSDVADAEGDAVARFMFHVEDLQGLLPLGTAGNFNPTTGLHERTAFALPAVINPSMPIREQEFMKWTALQVPGMNLRFPAQPLLMEASLHTYFQPGADPRAGNPQLDDVLTRMHQVVVRGRHLQLSQSNWKELLMMPDALAGWQGLQAEVLNDRDPLTGSLTNPVIRRLEEQTAGQVAPYDELALIPRDPAFSNLVAGTQPARKLNLNRLLYEIENEEDEAVRQQRARAAVDQIADHIQNHLPDFAGTTNSTQPNRAGRKGGYPLPLGGNNQQKARAYLQCLAAGIIDYADTDNVPTMDGDPLLRPEDDNGSKNRPADWDQHYPRYRGMDAYPVVSKQWQRYRLEESQIEGGASFAYFSVTHYLELWNMTNQVISGEVTAAYEVNARIPAGFRNYDLMACLRGGVDGATVEGNGRPVLNEIPSLLTPGERLPGYWHQPIRMDDPGARDADQRTNPFMKRGDAQPVFKPMQPNEVRVVAFAPVVYRLNIGSSSGTSAALTFTGYDAGNDLRSRYRLAFRPTGASGFVVVDQPLAPVDRLDRAVSSSTRQRFNLTLPGHSYANTKAVQRLYFNNLGDPRAAFFINTLQDYPNYEDGSSPWARTVRTAQQTRFFGQNRVHLWPDGGHISRGPKNAALTLNINPDDSNLVPAWHASKSANVVERQKYVQQVSNAGRYFSVTELGHVFDPIMWDPNGGSESMPSSDPLANLYREFANIRTGANATPSDKFCGGNTLRIGRPEHERFRPDFLIPPATGRPFQRSLCATSLLDLFHCGQPRVGFHTNPLNDLEVQQLTGDLVRIHGHVNLNTASRDTLRALVAGRLQADPRLRRRLTSEAQAEQNPTALENELHPPSSSAVGAQADLLAELIIRHRPYVTPAELPEKVVMPTSIELAGRPLPREMVLTAQPGIVVEEGQPVFGATRREGDRLIEPEWNDAVAEEAFARVFNHATVRSRNFKVVVTGQTVRRTRSGETKVLATRSRVYHVFIRPIRDPNGNLIRQQTEILYARTL
jgi:hypothetical protein